MTAARLTPLATLLALVLIPTLAAAIEAGNPANPFDHVGQAHNDGLDYIILHKDDLGASPLGWGVNAVQLTLDQRCGDGGERKPTCGRCLGVDTGTFTADLMDALSQEPQALLRSSGVSRVEAAYINRILTTLSELGTVDEDTSSREIFVRAMDTIEAIRAIEAQAIRRLGVRSGYRVLVGASVARYSTAYWAEEMLAPTSPWASRPGEDDRPMYIPWADVGVADCMGAIHFSVLGPEGTILGGVGMSAIRVISLL
ncbi:MAG: hypothetical protein AAF533_27525 [Acidobacteriota bacterium]